MESTYCLEAMVRGYHHAMHRSVLRYGVASSLRRLLRSGTPNGFACFSYGGGCFFESSPVRESAGSWVESNLQRLGDTAILPLVLRTHYEYH